MLGALAFKAVGQQHDQPAPEAPLVLAAGDELIHDHLSRVGEVPELGLPQDQAVRPFHAVAVLEPQRPAFRQRAVVNLESSLPRGQMLQGRVRETGLGVVYNRVAVRESSSLRVLAREADSVALDQQASDCRRLGRSPIQWRLALGHVGPLLEQPFDTGVEP